ncbi:MAG: histidine phosphatase family protein [Firmicutes bacterium]|nr:histidine phosphatase family protein [Bacillota bacterium]
MTRVFFVRHAQSDSAWADDRTRPLTPAGLADCGKVTALLSRIPVDVFLSSPYKRSVDTVSGAAGFFKMDIRTDERFRERRVGENGYAVETLERRWSDFGFHEEGGESLGSVRKRNAEALNDALRMCAGKNIVIGTHGTALSAILNYCDDSFGCEGFKRIRHSTGVRKH